MSADRANILIPSAFIRGCRAAAFRHGLSGGCEGGAKEARVGGAKAKVALVCLGVDTNGVTEHTHKM